MSLVLLILLAIKCSAEVAVAQDSNVCAGYLDYATIRTNKYCWYNPDISSTTEVIIRNHGYDYERHSVTTSDGYILSVFRVITNHHIGGTKGVVFLQHGMSTDSIFWVTFGNRSLAFQLADQGYDVWLGNARGTLYSKGHTFESISAEDYWNFSFHEMGIYDLPAEISLVANITGAKGNIMYIGHSMGTTMSYIYAQTPHATEHLKYIVSLAPIAYMGHVTSIAVLLVPFANIIQNVLGFLHIYDISMDTELWQTIISDFCLRFLTMELCIGVMSAVVGNDYEQLLPEDVPIMFENLPNAPASVKTLVHYDQIIAANGRFQYYDYGDKNVVVYGTKIPPIYEVQNIKLPVYIFYGENDAFAPPQDAMTLYSMLRSEKKIYKVPLDGKYRFNHLDFVSAKDIETLFYPLLYAVIDDNK